MLDRLGVTRDGDELTLTAATSDAVEAKHRFLQAIIHVSDMSILAQGRAMTSFADDIRSFLDENHVRYVEGAQFRGRSGLLCPYDFVLPSTGMQPERFCVPMRHPSQRLISSTLFSWEDTQAVRKTSSELVVFLNDDGRSVSDHLITALKRYRAYPIRWSERRTPEHLYKLAS